MALKKMNRSTLVEQVAAHIETMIKSGTWKVGEKIPPEPELVVTFDVGRNTIREAVKGLVHAGILEPRQGVGTIVKAGDKLGVALEREIRKNDLFETFEFRFCMEREAAMLAASHRTEADLAEMRRLLDKCAAARDTGDPIAFSDADVEFHRAIAIATHNTMFIKLYNHISSGLQKAINTHSEAKYLIIVERQVHFDLFAAIEAGDSTRAMEMVNKYLGEVIMAMRVVDQGKAN